MNNQVIKLNNWLEKMEQIVAVLGLQRTSWFHFIQL